MLQVRDLHAYYGKSHVLQGVDLDVREAEIVCLLGRNGSGRSTTCKAIMGEIRPVGHVHFKGRAIAGRRSHEIARLGVGYVPEGREIFPTLTVRQNLLLGMKGRRSSGRWRLEDMFTLFGNLAERADTPGGALSGGEQQMLAICRTLMGDPDLIMIDEPTEGLAPQLVRRVAALLQEIVRRGTSILLIEQKLTIALEVASRLYVLGKGRVMFAGTSAELRASDDVRREWLEV